MNDNDNICKKELMRYISKEERKEELMQYIIVFPSVGDYSTDINILRKLLTKYEGSIVVTKRINKISEEERTKMIKKFENREITYLILWINNWEM